MIENGELTLLKANAFVQEYNIKLSLREMRIVNYLIANIKSPKYDEEFREFDFSIKEFCKIVYPDAKQGEAYKWLPDVIQQLADKSAWKEIPDPDRPGKTKKVLLRWIEKPIFAGGNIKIKLDSDLAPYLLKLDKGYFQAKMKYSIEATCKYTIPLYELLKSWEKAANGTKRFEVDELRDYLDATAPSLKRYAEFKKSVLKVALNEINIITDLQVDYNEIKRGRKVEILEFVIKAKEQPKRAKKKDDIDVLPENITTDEQIKENDESEEFAITHYPIIVEEFPEFNGKQIGELFSAACSNVYFSDCKTFEEKQQKIVDYISPKLSKIKATPEDTKSTTFYRLLDMVRNNWG